MSSDLSRGEQAAVSASSTAALAPAIDAHRLATASESVRVKAPQAIQGGVVVVGQLGQRIERQQQGAGLGVIHVQHLNLHFQVGSDILAQMAVDEL